MQRLWLRASRVIALVLTGSMVAACAASNGVHRPSPNPRPGTDGEPVSIRELPLPPAAPSGQPGACTHPTGCLDAGIGGIGEGPSYTRDAKHVLLPVRFAGAPAAPDPRHAYSGDQVILIKTDGTTFATGEAWKCLTCGVADLAHANVQPPGSGNLIVDHPQVFPDGRRVLIGTNVLDCGDHRIIDDGCTPQAVAVYPIIPRRPGLIMRELRLHPAGDHLGFSEPTMVNGVYADQVAVVGGLQFNRAATRYELTDATYLVPNAAYPAGMIQPVPGDPRRLQLSEPTAIIGEFRGFTNDGKSALGIGTYDSWNYDLFVTDLATGESRRATGDPAYTDPADTSPDDGWIVYMDGRVNNRMSFAGALPGVPPLVDLVNAGSVQFLYNNGNRRFFEPYIARIPGRGENPSSAQQLNSCADPAPGSGSTCDPLWNGRADPAWSPDGTSIVYWQAMVVPPACGPGQPTAPTCPTSKEPGGRATRLMIADLTSRQPHDAPQPKPFDVNIPWATKLQPGQPLPARPHLAAGTYTLPGAASGKATVVVTENADRSAISSIAVRYDNFSRDGANIVNGTESVTAEPYRWHSNITLSGQHTGSRITSEPDGYVVAARPEPGGRGTITGELTTILDGQRFSSFATGQ